MKPIYHLILLVLFIHCASIFAENAPFWGEIKGKVVDFDSKQPLPYTTVSLYDAKDSSLVTGIITDSTGIFKFNKIDKGTYFLKYTFIGYNDHFSAPFSITSSITKMNAGVLQLSANEQQMKEVIVSGQTPLFVNAVDRKVYNIEKDMLSQSGVIADLLQNIPSVSVDIDGNIGLRGSDNVMILINGKPSNLTAASRASLLQTMQANSVERIEVLTNPSARYKPDGTSGIINIVLKKNTNEGFNGSVIVNVGNHDRYNANVAANYKFKKMNLNMSYGIRLDERNRIYDDYRNILNYDSITDVSTLNNSTEVYSFEKTKPLSQNASLGVDYDFNDQNRLTLFGRFNYRTQDRNAPTEYTTTNANNIITQDFTRTRMGTEPESELSGSLQYFHQFKKEGHELELINDYKQGYEHELFEFENRYDIPLRATTYEKSSLKEFTKEDDLEINYINPLSDNITLEAGYNFVYEQRDMPFSYENKENVNETYVNDNNKTNHFLYDQYIHALYTTYAQEISRFSFMLGLRAEHANINSKLLTLDTVIPNNYLSFFPSAHFKFQFNEKNELQFNYSRRVHRPESDDLNPFPEYRELNYIRAGNPKLKPEYINSMEVAYLAKGEIASFQATVYHRNTNNGFTSYTIPLNDSVLLSTYANLKNSQFTGIELITNITTLKKINTNLSINTFYNQFDASNIGLSSHYGNFVWTAKINSTASISPTSMLQLNASYLAPRLTAQGETLERYIVNMGFRQDVFKKRASITLTVSDLFNSMKETRVLDTNTLYIHSIKSRDSRVIYLGLVYRLGNNLKKGKENALQFDEKL